jgi:hypothetical protein
MPVTNVKAGDLNLDEENPRLPEDLAQRTQKALLAWMANEYNTIEVARSIAVHGFFDSEPLIAVKEKGKLVIVEGNRRLTALKLLLDAKLRESLELDEADLWEELANESDLEDSFPVVVAKNRNEVAPIIGYRHIAGVEPWDPWAKARFIANQVEVQKKSFSKVAAIVGEREADVRAHYRNYRLIVDSREKLKLSTERVTKKFGIFTRAMNSPALRAHMGAPAPNEIAVGRATLSRNKKDEVKEVFGWLFGDGGKSAVITDSRQISELGDVLASPAALKVLRSTGDLEEALLASGGAKTRLIKRLRTALQALERAQPDIGKFASDPEVNTILDRCSEIVGKLKNDDE